MNTDVSDAEIARLRRELIGGRVPLPIYARVKGISERHLYGLIAKHRLSFVLIDGVRYLDLAEAIQHGAPKPPRPDPEPVRSVGRPRKPTSPTASAAPRRRQS